MTEVDHIDVVGAQSVLEVAEVIAAILGARMEMGSEPGRIVVTGAPILIFGLSSGWRSTTAGYPKGGPDESRSPTLAVATNAVAGHRTYTAPSPNAATGHLPPREDHPDGALPAEGSDDRRVRALARICRPTDRRLPTLRWSMPGVMSDVPATGRARNRARRVREPINGSAGRLVVRSQPTMESTSSGGTSTSGIASTFDTAYETPPIEEFVGCGSARSKDRVPSRPRGNMAPGRTDRVPRPPGAET